MSSRDASGADPATIATLYEEQFRAFVAGAYAVVGDPEAARDVVQEAFARALRDGHRFRGEGPLEAWLWRIVINVARDSARRTRFAELSAEARRALRHFQCRSGRISHAYSKRIKKGRVIHQKPGPHKALRADNHKVRLVISKGKRP